MKVIHFKAIKLLLNLFSGLSTVILIDAGQVGIADVQVVNQMLYSVSHLCDTNKEKASSLMKGCKFLIFLNKIFHITVVV